MLWSHKVPKEVGRWGSAVKEDLLEEVTPKLSFRDRIQVGSVKRQAAWGQGREATDTETGCMYQGWGGGTWPSLEGKGLCWGHLWDTHDPEVETLTYAEKHNSKLRRLFLLPHFLTSSTSNQQAATIKERTLTSSKYPAEQVTSKSEIFCQEK